MAELKINIHDVSEAGKDYSFPLTASWFAETLGEANVRINPAAAEPQVTVHAQKNGTEYLVTGHIRADVFTDCYRCLEDAPVHVEADIASLFAHTSSNKKAPADDDLEELDYEMFSGHELVLDNLVREHVLLEIPMQAMCKEGCQGIEIPSHIKPPVDFGREDVDPRLAPLMKLAQAKRDKE